MSKTTKINAKLDAKRVIFEDILESLSQQLKQLCDKSGQENQHQLEQSAEIFHKMALHYKQKSPDKFSLIKSAGLLNAALVRNPKNASQVQTHFKDLCCEILKCANAKKQNVDLIHESNKIVDMIKEMRKYVKSELGPIQRYISQKADDDELFEYQTQKINSIRSLQSKITTDYTKIMSQISKTSEEIMGTAPCNFAVVGMGSLARNEITPYSDFEHVIVLEKDCEKQKNYFEILEYFRWFSVIFHVIIINLGETILPSLDIKVFDSWFYDGITNRGISFDGMMSHACKFPLGRQKHTENKPWSTELIKPVDEMLDYLSSEENLKNGYHLGDILTKTCFVYGSEKLSTNFREKVKKLVKTKMDDDAAIKLAKEIEKDFDNFSVKSIVSNLRSKKEVNIKKDWYRCTTLFIGALGRIHNVMASSCFEIVYSLYNKGVITENTKYKLLYVAALACEPRLRYYTEKSGQADVVDLRSKDNERIPKKFELIHGVQNTISYFQIAYSLQHVVAQHFNLKRNHFYSNPIFLNIFLCCALEFDRKMMLLLVELKQTNRKNSEKLDFDKLIDLLETDMRRTRRSSTIQPDKWSVVEKAEALKKIGYCLLDQSLFNDAHYFFTCSYIIANDFIIQENYDSTSINQHLLNEAEKMKGDNLIGQCRCQSKNKNCLEICLEALEIFTRLSKYPERDNDVFEALYHVGLLYMAQEQYDKASTYLSTSVEVGKKANPMNEERLTEVRRKLIECFLFSFYLSIYPHDSQESDGGANT